MATSNRNQITKIYELRTLGYDQVMKDLAGVNKAFDAIKKSKQEADKVLRTAAAGSDERKKALEQLEQERVKTIALRTERTRLTNELKAEANVRQADINNSVRKQKALEAEAGSIFSIRRQISELNALTIRRTQLGTQSAPINFRGELLSYDQAIQKLQSLISIEQEFRRQFAKDKTLVGEYTTGIIQAFQKLGATDLITGQTAKATAELDKLNREAAELKIQLDKLRSTGATEGLDRLETQMVQNRREAIRLEQEIERVNRELKGTGDVGNQVSSSLKRGFDSLRGQISGFVLGFIGVQALFAGIQRTVANTIAIDSLDTALANVSGTQNELAKNQQFLAETTERLGLEMIDTTKAFKNFYASAVQAGLTADQTRDIFAAAGEAAATLKLSQEDTNGVLLAFGQIASKGKVQAEELRGQIGERLPGAFSIAARAMGVTQQQLNKMLETGQVTSNEFLPKFAAELRRTFGGDTTKNVEGLQAAMARLKNQFTQLIKDNQKALTGFVSAVIGLASGLGAILGFLPQIIGILGLLAAAWAVNNTQLILFNLNLAYARALLIANNIYLAANRVITLAVTIAQQAYNIALALYTATIGRATAATILFGNATKLLGLGAILTVVGLLVGAFRAWGSTISGTTEALRRQALQSQILNDIRQKTNEAIASQISQLDVQKRVVDNLNNSFDTRKKALEAMIAINPLFRKALQDETIDLGALEQAYRQVTAAIRAKAEADASEQLSAEQQKKVLELTALRQKLQFAASQEASGGRFTATGLTRADQAVLATDRILRTTTGREAGKRDQFTFSESDLPKLVAFVTEKEKKATADYEVFLKVQGEKIAELNKLQDQNNAQVSKTDRQRAETEKQTRTQLEALIQGIDNEIRTLKEGDPKVKELLALRKSYQDRLKAFEQEQITGRGSKLTGEQKDKIKEIESERQRLLAIEETKVADLKRTNSFTFAEEEAHLNRIQAINLKAVQDEAATLEGKKNLNAEEKLVLAKFYKEIADIRLQHITDIADLRNREFSLEKQRMEGNLAEEIQFLRDKDEQIQNDPSIGPLAKAQHKLDTDRAILSLQELFNKNMDILEKRTGQQSLKNAQNGARAVAKLKADIKKEELELALATLTDIDAKTDEAIAKIRLKFDELKKKILEGKGSNKNKQAAIDILVKVENVQVATETVKGANEKVEAAKKLFEAGLITAKQYEEIYRRANEGQQQLNNAIEEGKEKITSFKQLLQGSFEKLFGFDKESEEAQALGQILTQTFDLARQAMDAFFNAKAARIEQEKEHNLKLLDIELQQRKAQAQGQAEQESLERQFQQKKEDVQKKAFEKEKKLKLAQAKIAFATTLVNLWFSASQYPFPANLIIFGVQSALATASYLIQKNAIANAQFRYGGRPDMSTTRGGRVGGRSHEQGGNPFVFKGRVFEDEVDELNVIRTKGAPKHGVYQIIGNQTQIASAANVIGGGVNFQPGAKVRRMETGGVLGSRLQAPVLNFRTDNIPLTNKADSQALALAIGEIGNNMLTLAKETNERIDRLQVVQDTRSVTRAQKKVQQQDDIGTF